MNNQIFGIVTILVSLLGYWWAFRKYQQGAIQLSILLLMACGLLLRFYTSADLFLHEWDERYHALVAKNLMSDPFVPTLYKQPLLPYDIKDWMGNHIWLHKQPVPLWSMAISMRLFGTNEIALRIPSILMSTLGIGMTFATGNYLFNRRVGFLAAFLYSVHGLIIELSAGRVATEHVDISFLFFIQLAIMFAIWYVKQQRTIFNIMCGMSIGLAILSKWLPALIVIPVWILIVLDSGKFSRKQILIQLLLVCLFTVVIFLPWQIYIHHRFPIEATWESAYSLRHFFEVIEGHSGPIYYHFHKMRIIFGELIYLPLLWFIWYGIKGWRNYRRLVILIWILIPFLFFSLAKTKMQGYTLFTAPAIFILTGLFWHYLYVYRNRFRWKWMIYIVLGLLLVLPVRYSIERIKPFSKIERNPGWAKELRTLGKYIEPGSYIAIFNVEHHVEAMFYTDCVVYPFIPDLHMIETLRRSGYQVYINDTGDLDQDILNSENIEIIYLSENNE